MTTTGRKQIGFLLAAVAIAMAAFLLFLWKGAFLPREILWEEDDLFWEDLRATLKDRTFSLYQDDRKIWSSEWDWNVQALERADLDGDGIEELLLLVWKRGSYGDHMPFWVKRNDHDLEQHIFIYRRDRTRHTGLRAAWMSSSLGSSIKGMYTDANRVAIEKTDGTFSLWQWENFGLKLLDDAPDTAHVLALGDQILHASLIAPGMKSGDYSYMYAGIRDEIRMADLASLNQETPLVADRSLISDYPRFGSPQEIADAVADLGIDVVSTANNHALDQGMVGVDTTIQTYERLGIIPVGTHASDDPAVEAESSVRFIEVNDIRIALLGFTYGTNGNTSKNAYAVERFANEERLKQAIRYAKENAHAVIVYAHWGTEYSKDIDDEQKRLTELLLKEGVDVVIGTHPHVVQDYEIMSAGDGHKMLVYYSLGNLISAQEAEECRHGGVASFVLVRSGAGSVLIASPKLLSVYTEQRSVKWE